MSGKANLGAFARNLVFFTIKDFLSLRYANNTFLFQWFESIDNTPDDVISWSALFAKFVYLVATETYYYCHNATLVMFYYAIKFLYGVQINVVYEAAPRALQ